ncbi:MAG: peroxiredoxin [Proteobacteria bacterium]|nr:peroxiredoxin [Pseudomonadota bacterium]
MPIQIGDRLPDVTLMTMTVEGPKPLTTAELFNGKTVALIAVPGAFTPTCSARHLPGFKERAGELKGHGVDRIACVSVNDVFVMGAWAENQGLTDEIILLADGSGEFTRAIGLEMDASKFGMGVRSRRYSMLVRDGLVEKLNIEEPGQFNVSSAEHLLEQLAA